MPGVERGEALGHTPRVFYVEQDGLGNAARILLREHPTLQAGSARRRADRDIVGPWEVSSSRPTTAPFAR